jgi:hypothetical protein
MFKRLMAKWSSRQPSILPLLAVLVLAPAPLVRADTVDLLKEEIPIIAQQVSGVNYSDSAEVSLSKFSPDFLTQQEESQDQQDQIDPLGSPFPIPWNWIMTTQDQLSQKGRSQLSYYRTPSLISPDGKYAAYTRVKMEVKPELHQSKVTSVMFLEDLETGKLQIINANSPIAAHLRQGKGEDMAGVIDILIPISWSSGGENLLCRQFEGFLSSSDASDYAVVWNRQQNRSQTLVPQDVAYTHAILLGWNQNSAGGLLFRAGILGEEEWGLWAVAMDGKTAIANKEEPMVYGKLVEHSWTGAQVF